MTEFRSLAQLKSMVWPSKVEAIKELKRNALKERGEDYEIAETEPGSGQWFIRDLHDAPPGEAAPKPEPAKGNGKGNGKTAPATEQFVKAAAAAKKGPGKAKPKADQPKAEPKVTAPKPEPAKKQATAKKAAPKKAAAPKKKAAAPKPEPTPPPSPEPEPQNDLTPMPAGQDYWIRIKWPAHSVVLGAVSIAQGKNREVLEDVEIVGAKDGKVYRKLDGRIATGGKAPKAVRTPAARTGVKKGPSGTGKSAQAAKLLLREKGATYDQLKAVTEWSFGEAYIDRLAGVHNATKKSLGERHWRLIPKQK